MKLTCAQMDVLISFYLEGELSSSLKKQVEEHIKACSICKAKFDIIKSMITDLKKSVELEDRLELDENKERNTYATTQHYRVFKNNLSAYLDNELSSDENIKIKKFTINNSQARQDLEESYNIRKLMNDSFKKTESEARHDFSKSVLRKLELDEDVHFGIHPAIKLIIAFTFLVLILTSFVLISLGG